MSAHHQPHIVRSRCLMAAGHEGGSTAEAERTLSLARRPSTERINRETRRARSQHRGPPPNMRRLRPFPVDGATPLQRVLTQLRRSLYRGKLKLKPEGRAWRRYWPSLSGRFAALSGYLRCSDQDCCAAGIYVKSVARRSRRNLTRRSSPIRSHELLAVRLLALPARSYFLAARPGCALASVAPEALRLGFGRPAQPWAGAVTCW